MMEDTLGIAARDGVGGRTKLITVHGTGAGDESTTGTRWWQLGSPFLVELAKRLQLDPAEVEIIPFQWDIGPNSENSRRDAGRRLYQTLKQHDLAGDDYHVIGHSHGGSVIYQALLHSVSGGLPLERLKSWSTVGTPFLDYRPNRHLYQRLGGSGLTLYASAIGALVLAFILNARVMFITSSNWTEWLAFFIGTIPFLVYGLGCLLGLYLYDKRSGDVQAEPIKAKVSQRYADRWIGLWHRDDEAISALRNVKTLDAPIVGSNLFDPIVSLLPILLLAGVASYFAALSRNQPEALLLTMNAAIEGAARWIGVTDNVTSFMQFTETLVPDNAKWVHDIVVVLTLGVAVVTIVAVAVAAYVLLARPIVDFLKGVVRLIGRPTSSLINSVVWSSVRQQAWGNDRASEAVHLIDAHPPAFAARFGPLPDVIGDELSRYSERHAILTLTKVRELLGMTPEPKTTLNFRTQLSEQLSWKELIHTTYFDVPEFVDVAAISLNRAGLGKLNDDYWSNEKRETALGWYQAIASPQRQSKPETARTNS